MSSAYKPKGKLYKFTIVKDSAIEFYIGTEKGIKAYKPDKIVTKELLNNEQNKPKTHQ